MPKATIPFEDFLSAVDPNQQAFVLKTHDYLLQNGCSCNIEPAKSGYLVSYKHSKKVLANFVFRKIGLLIRIYGDCVHQYPEFLETLPAGMTKAIEKAPVCRRLTAGTCNPKCGNGYVFPLHDSQHQKCRYNAFMFPVNEENNPFIRAFLEAS